LHSSGGGSSPVDFIDYPRRKRRQRRGRPRLKNGRARWMRSSMASRGTTTWP